MANNEFKKIGIKNRTCYYIDGITEIEDFDFNNILLAEKSYESYKNHTFLIEMKINFLILINCSYKFCIKIEFI